MSERQMILHDRPIAFPDITNFNDLFDDVKPHMGESRTLLTLPSWDCGSWSDRSRREKFQASGYLIINNRNDYRLSLDVNAKKNVIEYIKASMLHCGNDRSFFEIVVWDDGRALVVLSHNVIIGSYYLAIIDANTLPKEKDINKAIYQIQHDKYLANDMSHDAFHCWLSDFIGLTDGMIPVSNEEIKASTDPHYNDIRLLTWDSMHYSVKEKAYAKGLAWARADTVCCLKSMARRRAKKG